MYVGTSTVYFGGAALSVVSGKISINGQDANPFDQALNTTATVIFNTIDVTGKLVTLAKNGGGASAADGAGIRVEEGGNNFASITYNYNDFAWVSNRDFYVNGVMYGDLNYTATTSTDWTSPSPTTVTEALDRLAAGATGAIANPLADIFTITNTTQATSTVTGALQVRGGVGIGGDLYVGGLTSLTRTTETLSTQTGSTGTVTHDITNGNIFYHSGIAGDFTANFTNVPTTDNKTISLVLVLAQGTSTAYLPTAVEIDSAAQTILWQGSSTPSGTANKTDVVGFTLIRAIGTWTVIGSVTSYGAP